MDSRRESFSLKLITLNVRGLCNYRKRNSLFKWVIDNKIDIAMLQETFITEENVNKVTDEWNGQCFFNVNCTNHSKGVAILVRAGIDINVKSVHKSADGRLVLLNCEYGSEIITIVSAYAPNNDQCRIEFFKHMQIWVNRYRCDSNFLINGADFNTALTEHDRSTKITSSDKAIQGLKKYMKMCNAVDIWSEKCSTQTGFTWVSPSDPTIQSRIDYICVSKCLTDYISKCTVMQSAPVPDHKALCIVVTCVTEPRGPGYWKLNNTLLKEPEYINGIENIFNNTLLQFDKLLCSRDLWDLCKIRFKEFSIKFGVKMKQQKDKSLILYEQKLKEIDENLACSNRTESQNIEELKNVRLAIKIKIDKILEERTVGSMIRSKAVYYDEGEKQSSFFLGMEKKRQKHNCIQALEDKSGSIVFKSKDILHEASQFYKKLYSSQSIVDEEIMKFLKQVDVFEKLSDEEKAEMDRDISLHECTNVVKKLKSNKSPGIDGLTNEFYQTFWHLIGNFIITVYKEAYTSQELSESQKLAVMALIYKKHEKYLLKNYRPISLTCTDYKILAFVIAERTHKVLKKIINTDQNGYIKGRFIGFNTRLIQDIIDICMILTTKHMQYSWILKKRLIVWNGILYTVHLLN